MRAYRSQIRDGRFHSLRETQHLRELKFTLPERALETLFGPQDQNIKFLESLLSVSVGGRGSELFIEGDEADVAIVERILKDYSQLFNEGKTPTDLELRDAFKQIAEDRSASFRELLTTKKSSTLPDANRSRRVRRINAVTWKRLSKTIWYLASGRRVRAKPFWRLP